MNIQIEIRILMTLAFIALLSACGSSTTPNEPTNFASTGTPVTPSSKPVAKCNKAGSATLSYRTVAQTLGSGYDPNFVNLYLQNLPTGFEAGSSYIQFFKGQPTSDTALGFSTTPVSFAIYDTQNPGYLDNSKVFTSLVWNDVKNLIAGATPASFMARVIFVLVLNDPNSTYQVIAAGSYNTTGSSIIEAVHTLLPAFHANPADYAVKSNGVARETVLKNLHPLRNQTGDYASLATQLCI